MKTIQLAALVLIALAAAACSPAASSVAPTPEYTRVIDATFATGASIPAPQGDVVLRVTGKIGTSNVEGETAVEFDLPTLESLGVVEFDNKDLVRDLQNYTFRGVLLADVLRAVQIDEDATTLRMLAFDDYTVDAPISDTEQHPVLIATHQGGSYLSLETFGPLRIVYPPSASPDIDERWIWTLISIDVR